MAAREDPRRAALALAARLYRAAVALQPADAFLADALARAALALPPAAADPAARAARLAEAETVVELAAELGLLPDAGPLLAALDAYRSNRPAPPAPPAGAPAPTPAARPAAAPVAAGPRDRVLVDACNYLGRTDSLGDEAARERLITRLQDHAHRHPALLLTAVFDGRQATTRTVGGVEVRTTSAGRPADDVLVDTLRGLPAAERRRAVVVTDDRELAARTRALGARVEGGAWLQARLKEPAARAPAAGRADGVPRRDVAEWEEYFRRPPERPGEGGGRNGGRKGGRG